MIKVGFEIRIGYKGMWGEEAGVDEKGENNGVNRMEVLMRLESCWNGCIKYKKSLKDNNLGLKREVFDYWYFFFWWW